MPLIRRPGPPSEPAPPAFSAAGLASASPDERWTAARRLGETAEGRAALIAALPAEQDARVVEAMLSALARSGAPEAGEALAACVASDEAMRRTAAMDALRSAPDLLAPRLERLLADPDPDVRLLACDLARALPPAQASSLLCARLPEETEVNVVAAAVESLAEVGDESCAAKLTACAERFAQEPFLRFAITEAARRLSARADVPRG